MKKTIDPPSFRSYYRSYLTPLYCGVGHASCTYDHVIAYHRLVLGYKIVWQRLSLDQVLSNLTLPRLVSSRRLTEVKDVKELPLKNQNTLLRPHHYRTGIPPALLSRRLLCQLPALPMQYSSPVGFVVCTRTGGVYNDHPYPGSCSTCALGTALYRVGQICSFFKLWTVHSD